MLLAASSRGIHDTARIYVMQLSDPCYFTYQHASHQGGGKEGAGEGSVTTMVVFFLSYSIHGTAKVCTDRLSMQMSAATAGLARPSSSANAEASPCFALPLHDGAADLEQSALLKVIPRLRREFRFCSC